MVSRIKRLNEEGLEIYEEKGRLDSRNFELEKNIVEAHCGITYGDNNKDSTGATFSFSLPLNHLPSKMQ
jgi:hypothetical protein